MAGATFVKVAWLSYLYEFVQIPWHTNPLDMSLLEEIMPIFTFFEFFLKLFIFSALKLQKEHSFSKWQIAKLRLYMGRNLQSKAKTAVIGDTGVEKSPPESY